MSTSNAERPSHRQYASRNRPENPSDDSLERGRKRRLIDTIAEARKLGEELMDPWDEE